MKYVLVYSLMFLFFQVLAEGRAVRVDGLVKIKAAGRFTRKNDKPAIKGTRSFAIWQAGKALDMLS